jgi:hypothetical protein
LSDGSAQAENRLEDHGSASRRDGETQHKEAHHQAGLRRSDVAVDAGRLMSMPKDGNATRKLNSKVKAMEAGGTRMGSVSLG